HHFSGPVKSVTAVDEIWSGIDAALRLGRRGLARGSSLARLLYRRRGVRSPRNILPWTSSKSYTGRGRISKGRALGRPRKAALSATHPGRGGARLTMRSPTGSAGYLEVLRWRSSWLRGG